MKEIIAHIYIGEDEKLVKSEINKLESKFNNNDEVEFYFADETSSAEILSAAENLALFGNRKIIKVYNFDKSLKDFVSYLEQTCPANPMILISFKPPKDVVKKIKNLSSKKYVKINSFYKPKSPARELINKLEKRGVILQNKAKQYLMENFNLSGDIEDTVNLLSAFPNASDNGLSLDDIYPHISGESNFFTFVDNAFSRDNYSTLIEFEKLMHQGTDLLFLLKQLHNYLKDLWQTRYLMQNNRGIVEIKNMLGNRGWKAQEYINRASKYTFKELRMLIGEIHKMDVNIKSKDQSLHKVLFELMLLKFS